MFGLKRCGVSDHNYKHPEGCYRHFAVAGLERCWHCGFLFCIDCYPAHLKANKVKHEGKLKYKGGEK